MLRAASLRPVSSRFPASRMLVQTRRQQSTSPGAGNRTPGQDQGKTEKEFEKDGTGSNKNLVYFGVGAIGLAGLYAFYTGRAEQVVTKAEDKINEKTKR